LRPSRHLALVAAGVALAAVGVSAWWLNQREPPRPPALPAPEDARELVVLIHEAPVVYFAGPDGSMVGFDADLLRLFAAERGWRIRYVSATSPAQVADRIAGGEAHVGAGGLFQPRPAAPAPVAGDVASHPPAAAAAGRDPAPPVLWTAGYRTVELLLICNRDGFRPAGWRDLEGASVAYVDARGLAADIANVRTAHPGIEFRALDLPSTAGLIAQVSDGTIDYAIVGSLAAAAARGIYIDYEVAFPLGVKRELAWAVSPRFAGLRDDLDRFLARVQRDGTIRRLVERYMPDAGQFQRIDAGALQQDMRTELPQWRALFHDVQEKTGIEWRLLAAIAYQESKWDPYATSETGVRGLMQITEDTAKHLGIRDRMDPAVSVLGAARYLRDLKAKLPARIHEPDRTWLALAAFNIGLGHLEDARVLAQKQKLDPDHWNDVKRVLPLLALPEFHADAKYGYARGGMPVAFVDRVRGYYDILLARQPPLAPHLRMVSDVEPEVK
jgi:membrane-bound lytic murein transglycosylase F